MVKAASYIRQSGAQNNQSIHYSADYGSVIVAAGGAQVDTISGAAIPWSQIDSNSSRAKDARQQTQVITDVYDLNASDTAIVNAMCYYGTGIMDAYEGANSTSNTTISSNFRASAASLEATVNSLKNRLSVDAITAESIAVWIIDNNTPRSAYQ